MTRVRTPSTVGSTTHCQVDAGISLRRDVVDDIGDLDLRRGPGTLHDEVMAWVDLHDDPADVVVLSGADDVTGSEFLVFRDDPIGAVDVTANEVLKAIEAVEPASTLTELGEPRPHLIGRRVDRDGAV